MNDDLALRIVGSKGKAKIILLLARYGELNITRIVKLTRLNYALVERHLRELEEAGLVEEHRVGRARMFSLRFDNPRLPSLLDLLQTLEG